MAQEADGKILTPKQAETLREFFAAESALPAWQEEIARRSQVAVEFKALVEGTLLAGAVLSTETLVQIIRLEWRIQNLQPMSLLRLIGTYNYYRHFKDFKGTREEFSQFMAERRGEWKEGTTGYPGADLPTLSRDFAAVLTKKGAALGSALSHLLEHEGVGQGFATCAMALFDPRHFALVNGASCFPFEENTALQLSDAQRKAAGALARARFGVAPPETSNAAMKAFARMAVLLEVAEQCEREDLLEIDWLLWRYGDQHKQGTRAGEQVGRYVAGQASQPLDHLILEEIISSKKKEMIEARREAEAAARAVLNAKVGKLTEDEIRKLLWTVSTDIHNGRLVHNRFKQALAGRWAQTIAQNHEVTNRWMEQLWRCSDEEVPAVLDAFWSANEVEGAGFGFPTILLYLRDPHRYTIWTTPTQQGLDRTLGRTTVKQRTSKSYLAFNREALAMMETFAIAPEALDAVLWSVAQHEGGGPINPQPSEPSPAEGQFRGFPADAFKFMSELAANNKRTWFKANVQRFRQHVRDPLRDLVADLGERLIADLPVALERAPKSPNTLSLIRKNLWKKQDENCYWPHLWAAFHRKERNKTADFQLYVFIRGDGLGCGMAFGSASDADIERLLARAKAERALVEEVLSSLPREELAFIREGEDSKPLSVHTLEDFEQVLTDSGRVSIQHWFKLEQPVVTSAQFVAEVERIFTLLMPLFLLAVADQPRDVIAAYHARLEESLGEEVEEESEAPTLDQLCEQTLLEPDFFDTLTFLLEDKGQVVFAGPPGTGKTFVAERFARYWTGSPERVALVQFHPSYSYEDFIEGLRPVAKDGVVHYCVEEGIFKLICARARRQPQKRFLLIIDEINRGNLSRIFGELMYLLERRGESVQLPYSQESFSVPPNLFLIGTMNTADHSIALVDFALRRRFHFMDFEPDADVLRAWLERHAPGMVWVERLLRDLNKALKTLELDRNLSIGHSHFMRPGLDLTRLERIWEHSVAPTLEEYFFGQSEKLKQVSFEELTATARVEPASVEEEVDDVTV